MFDHTTHRGIGHSISFRAGLLSELAIKLAEQDKRDEELRKRLLEKAPHGLEEWLTEDGVFTSLFQYGKWSTNINFGEYGFKDAADTRAKVAKLKKAWSDVVSIDLDRQAEPDRIAVSFSALI